MFVPRGRSEQIDAFGRQSASRKSRQQLVADELIVERNILDQQSRARHPLEDPGPDCRGLVGDFADAVEDTERDETVRNRRRLRSRNPGRQRRQRHKARQVDDGLRKQMPNRQRNRDRIREQIIDRRQPGAGAVAPAVRLDRCRLARKYAEAVSSGVAGQIDQDIDAIGANLCSEAIVGPLRGVTPAIGEPLKFACRPVHFRRTRVAHDLELCPVMVLQDRLENERGRMRVEVRRDVAKHQAPVRVAAVVMRCCRF